MVSGRTMRLVGLSIALALACWFAFDSLAGIFMYSIQGDLCRKVRGQLETLPASQWSSAFKICAQREGPVYRAFILELLTATGLVALVVRGISHRLLETRAKQTSAKV